MDETDQTEIKWEKDNSTFEIRTQGTLSDGKPALDEVVATGADVHLEQMDHDSWWMGIEAGGKYFRLWFTLGHGRLCVRLTDQMMRQSGKATTEKDLRPERMNKLTAFRCDRKSVFSPSLLTLSLS